ncbi:hypothetical protein MBLNU457_2207t1 [Dothideomycetes sp. NU457]
MNSTADTHTRFASAENTNIANDGDTMNTTTETTLPAEAPAVADDLDAMIQSQISDEMAREMAEHATTPAPVLDTKDTKDHDDHEDSEGPGDPHKDHAGGCCGSPGASTPPTSPRPSNTRASQDHDKATTETTIPVEIREQKALHKKALALRPTMPANRYCIGILNPRKLPKNVRKEDDFVWMKGHKNITVNTVWHQYRQQTGEADNFELVIQGFTPKKELRMGELDFYNDKHVIFRAIRTVQIDDGIDSGLMGIIWQILDFDDLDVAAKEPAGAAEVLMVRRMDEAYTIGWQLQTRQRCGCASLIAG